MQHMFQVIIERSDRDKPLIVAPIVYDGEDYEAFGPAEARAALIASGRLVLGSEWVTLDDTVIPARHVDRIRVELISKSR